MLGFLLIGAFAVYYLMPQPITGPSSQPQPPSEDEFRQFLLDSSGLSADQKALYYNADGSLKSVAEADAITEGLNLNGQTPTDIPKNGVVGTYDVPTNSH